MGWSGRMSMVFFAALLAVVVFPAGCSNGSGGGRPPLLVFAATSLTNSLDEVAVLYERETGMDIQISYAASQNLAQQIASGAPARVFVSAGEPPVEFLRKHRQVSGEVDLLTNRLVVVAKRPVDDPTPDALASPGVERIALADPAIAPAGAYAREALESAGLWEILGPKMVTAPDVRAAMAFVEAGNADVAIVYATDAVTARGLVTLDIFPHDSYGPVVYPVVTVAPNDGPADAFVRFLRSPDALKIFRSHGFEPVR